MKKEYTRHQLEDVLSFLLRGLEDGSMTRLNPEHIISEWEKKNKPSDDVSLWIEDWLDLWPIGIRNKGGILLKSKKDVVLKKMKDFLKCYPYDKETIFKATKRYLKSCESEMYSYARASTYFISKIEKNAGKVSTLANECDRVKEIENNEHNTRWGFFNENEDEQEETNNFFI